MKALDSVAVSLFVPRDTGSAATHPLGRATAYRRRLQSSALVLANGADFCSDYLTMGQASCSHYLPLRLPSSGRARQRTIVLTLAASGICVSQDGWGGLDNQGF